MKIILAAVNAKYIHTNLAVYDLKGYADQYGDFCENEIQIREYTINQLEDDILQGLYQEKPDVIAFSCYIWNIEMIRSLAVDLRKILPDTKIWAGGPEVSYDAPDFLRRNPVFFGIIKGEGEETFLRLALAWKKQEQKLINDEELFQEIRGICRRTADGIIDQEESLPVDLSRVPFVYRSLPFLDDTVWRDKIIYYESSRGCPFSCSYCLSSVDKKVRFRSIDLVREELRFFLDRRVPQVKFVDRTFNCRHEHSMAIWKYLIEHDNGVTNFHFELAADLITEEELQLMSRMRPGLIQLEIGVQSTNPATIREIRRTMDFSQVSNIVKRIHGYGNIHIHLDLIAGLPCEDYERFHRSFLDVYALHPNQLQLGFLKVLKGSYLAQRQAAYEVVHKEAGPYEILSTRWLSYSDIRKLKTVESMVEIYYNSGQFTETLQYLETLFPDMFRFYERLGAFYEGKEYFQRSHSRLRRYEILLEFLENKDVVLEITDHTSGSLEISRVRDLLMVDYCLRERLKKMPSFAFETDRQEKEIREFRRRNKIPNNAQILYLSDGRILLFDYEKRDPLTQNAECTDITDEIMIQEEKKYV